MASRALIAARIEARRQIVPVTSNNILGDATFFITNQRFHENHPNRQDGTCYEWRQNGQLQLWKTMPNRFRLPIKFGLRQYGEINADNVGDFHFASSCPVDQVEILADSRA
jgi:hypothetical protein